jgi:thiamine biosynthesis lipoprotein
MPLVEQSSCFVAMDTLVSATFVGGSDDEHALGVVRRWFAEVERACNRFDPASEINTLVPGRWLTPSPTLFHSLSIAVTVAAASEGAFDPSLGHELASHGFDRHYLSGDRVRPPAARGDWRDLELDHESQRLRLRRRVTFDLGGLAKGLALDLAAAELAELDLAGFALDAGGDLIVRGSNPDGVAWRVGVRDPRQPSELIATLQVDDQAVCSSGGYRRGPHLLNPGDGLRAEALGATVVTPVAAIADALSTAATVLAPEAAIALLEASGVDGIVVARDGTVAVTHGLGELK